MKVSVGDEQWSHSADDVVTIVSDRKGLVCRRSLTPRWLQTAADAVSDSSVAYERCYLHPVKVQVDGAADSAACRVLKSLSSQVSAYSEE